MNRTKQLVFWVVCAFLNFAIGATASAQHAKKQLRIMVVSDGPSDEIARSGALMREEMKSLLGAEYNISYLQPRAPTDWTMPQVKKALSEALSRDDVDVVIGAGPLTGVAVGRIAKLRKPVVIPFAAPDLQGLPRDGDVSGRKNLTYITGLINFERELRKLQDIVRFEKLHFIVGKEVVEHLSDSKRPIEEAAKKVGVTATVAVSERDAEKTLAAVPEDAQVVYFGGLLSWPDAEVQKLVDGLNARALPSYAGDGPRWVEAGALATMETQENDVRRMRRVALYVQRILFGEDAGTLSVSFEQKPELLINMSTARAIAAWPRFEVMSEAKLINDTSGTRGPMITLESAIRDALAANLDLTAARTGVSAGHENVREARGGWGPNADASASYTIIDPDGATAGFASERTFRWGVDGSQVIYSPKAHGNLRGQKAQQRGVVQDYNALRLDIMLEAAEAYLNLLRAKNGERVNRDNLSRARRNLALAETRNAIGSAGREEVYRWQIEIADSRAATILANAQRNQAEIELNRTLNRPLEESFQTPSESSDLPTYDPRLEEYVDDPWSFKLFREFMVGEAINLSPEIKEIDAGIDAQTEALKVERRSLGIPEVALNGGFEHIPHVGGAGSENMTAFGATRNQFNWSVGVGASLNLFDGTQRYARIRRANHQIDQLETQRAAAVQRVEQRIRSALHQAGASSAAIDLTRDAAVAALENLNLVTDAYRRGAVDIIRLIDAQNQALQADLGASNAIYDFLIDLMRVERASGAFTLEGSPERRNGFFKRLEDFAKQKRTAELDRIRQMQNGSTHASKETTGKPAKETEETP